jgi:hypothetical protein
VLVRKERIRANWCWTWHDDLQILSLQKAVVGNGSKERKIFKSAQVEQRRWQLRLRVDRPAKFKNYKRSVDFDFGFVFRFDHDYSV